MRRIVERYIETEGLLAQGDTILAGVSGGADSVCLFLLLKEICADRGIPFEVAHVNHCIRGTEADEDEAFVVALCKRHGIYCHTHRVDVPALAKKNKMGLEEAGRLARRRIYRQWASGIGKGAKIALGHHRDDLVETMLFSLIRGTGLSGICGIRSKSWINEQYVLLKQGDKEENITNLNLQAIHPLLCVNKKEIESYLLERNQEWKIDSTNLNQDYTRNKIRHNIIPALEEINGGAREHLARSAEILGGCKDYIDTCAKKALQDCRIQTKPDSPSERGSYALDRRKLGALDPALLTEVIRRWIAEARPDALHDLSYSHIEAARDIALGKTGRQIDLPGDVVIKSSYQELRIEKKEKDSGAAKRGVTAREKNRGGDEKSVVYLEKPDLGENCEVAFGDYVFHFAAESCEDQHGALKTVLSKQSENFFSICVDYDKINDVCVCFPAGGEKIAISRSGSMKKVTRLLIDQKVPQSERGRIPLLFSGNELVWVVGVRDCPLYFVEDDTRRVLRCVARRREDLDETVLDDSSGSAARMVPRPNFHQEGIHYE